MFVYTKTSSTKLYNQNVKVHGSSPISGANVKIEVGNLKTIKDNTGKSYSAYQLVNPDNAYVMESDIYTVSSPPPPPPPPPPQDPPPSGKTVTHTITVYSDGSIDVDGIPYP